jgi:hypothetical protein
VRYDVCVVRRQRVKRMKNLVGVHETDYDNHAAGDHYRAVIV